jgi:hypothetical protein
VTHGNDDFQVDALDFANQIVQLGFAFGLQNSLSKSKKASAA